MGRPTHGSKPEWTYFVTTRASQNISVFQVTEAADLVIAKMLGDRTKGQYLLHDFVLMPDQLHTILTAADLVTLEKFLQSIKSGSSHEVHKVCGSKMEVWQSGFQESRATDPVDYKKKSDYNRFNPFLANLVDRPELGPFSSASGPFKCDPISQGPKPIALNATNVGSEGPTPNTRFGSAGAC